MENMLRRCFRIVFIFVATVVLAASAFADGTLFIGTDEEDFLGTLPDRLGKFATTGPVIGPGVIIPLDYPLNGMVNGGGFLYAGDALSTGSAQSIPTEACSPIFPPDSPQAAVTRRWLSP
jgi:hypothetical protein